MLSEWAQGTEWSADYVGELESKSLRMIEENGIPAANTMPASLPLDVPSDKRRSLSNSKQ